MLLIALPVSCLAICRSGPQAGGTHGGVRLYAPTEAGVRNTRIHTITPDSVSAQQIARRYGYRGDWRDYMELIRQANHWRGWPLLSVGDQILVPIVSTGAQPCAPTSTHTVGQVSNLPAGVVHAAVPRAGSHSREVALRRRAVDNRR